MLNWIGGISWSLVAAVFLIVVLPVNDISLQRTLPDEVEVDITFVDVSIDSALLLLSSESDINISYNNEIIPQDVRRTVDVRKLKLGIILDEILYETGLIYKIVANQLSIIKNPKLIPKPIVTLNGWIAETGSEERIPFASIYTQDGSSNAQTNEFGYFSMGVPQGVHVLSISSIYHTDKNLTIDLIKDSTVALYLEPLELNEVLITDKLPSKSKNVEQFDQVPLEQIGSMGVLAGEPDIFRMVQMRAGVSSGADGLGGLSLRGGNTDQNLILMDGMPVYNTGHALGLFSIFNASAIKDFKIIKSGFPARYGGRLSSVMDVTMKEGNKNEIEGEFAVNPLLVRALLEGPIKKGRSSFVLSGRRTIVDPWLKPLSRYSFELDDQQGFINYKFYDINAKLNVFLGENDEFYFTAYTGQDKFDNDVLGNVTDDRTGSNIEELDVIAWDWGNDILSARWAHYFSNKLSSYVNIGYSRYQFESFNFDRSVIDRSTENEQLAYAASLYRSDIQDYVINGHIDFFMSSNYYLKAGFNIVQHRLSPGSIFNSTRDNLLDNDERITPEIINSLFDIERISGSERRLFVENELTFSNLMLNAGLHWSHISTDNNSYGNLEPRLAAKLAVGETSVLKFSYSQMDQYLHLLSSSGFGLPNDIWIPSTDRIRPQTSNEFSISFAKEFSSFGTLTLSIYDRNMDGVRALSQGGFLAIGLGDNWQEELPVGSQDAYGFELELDKRVGYFKGWVNYTFAKATSTFDLINDGQTFASRLDRRHAFKINALYKVNDNLELTCSWQLSSGLPYTSPVSLNPVLVEDQLTFVPIFGKINNIQLPSFHRFDFSVNLYNDYSWGKQKLSVGAYNAYNRLNPFYIDVIRDSGENSFRPQSVSIVPIFPFVSISISI